MEERIELYSQPFWQASKNRETQPPEITEWWRQEGRYLVNSIDRDSVVIDVGCGGGRTMALLGNMVEFIMGIDVKRDVLEEASKMCNPRFVCYTLIRGDITKRNRGLRDEYFDYVVCTGNTFGNLGKHKDDTVGLRKKKLDALKEINRILKFGCEAFVSVYSEQAMEEPHITRRLDWYKQIGIHVKKIEENRMYATDGLVTETFTKDEIYGLADAAKMRVDIEELGPIAYMAKFTKITL